MCVATHSLSKDKGNVKKQKKGREWVSGGGTYGAPPLTHQTLHSTKIMV